MRSFPQTPADAPNCPLPRTHRTRAGTSDSDLGARMEPAFRAASATSAYVPICAR
jgi:hypothetical protein